MTVVKLMLLLLAFAVGIALLGVAASWYLQVAVRRMVSARYRDLEEIAGSGQAPTSWTRAQDRAVARAGSSTRKARHLRIRAAGRNVKRLDSLARHVSRSTLVHDDHTRGLLLERIAHARKPYADMLHSAGRVAQLSPTGRT